MKSPRDILLGQHREQLPALDEIRRQVIAHELRNPSPPLLATLPAWLTLNRAAWSSLAAAWVVIIALNSSANLGDKSNTPVRSQADARKVLEGVREYQSQLALLLFDQESIEDRNQIDEPKKPGPRSEVRQPCRHA
jgi:hypothetical protein